MGIELRHTQAVLQQRERCDLIGLLLRRLDRGLVVGDGRAFVHIRDIWFVAYSYVHVYRYD